MWWSTSAYDKCHNSVKYVVLVISIGIIAILVLALGIYALGPTEQISVIETPLHDTATSLSGTKGEKNDRVLRFMIEDLSQLVDISFRGFPDLECYPTFIVVLPQNNGLYEADYLCFGPVNLDEYYNIIATRFNGSSIGADSSGKYLQIAYDGKVHTDLNALPLDDVGNGTNLLFQLENFQGLGAVLHNGIVGSDCYWTEIVIERLGRSGFYDAYFKCHQQANGAEIYDAIIANVEGASRTSKFISHLPYANTYDRLDYGIMSIPRIYPYPQPP